MAKRKNETDSEWRERHRKDSKSYTDRPDVKARRKEQERARYNDPDRVQWRKAYAQRPEVKARARVQNAKKRASPEYQAKLATAEFKAERLSYQRKYLGTPKRLLRGAKIRAAERGTVCTITSEYIDAIIPVDNCCPYCREEMLPLTKYARSLDEVIAGQGYVEGNVEIICRRCNTQKADTPVERLEAFAAHMRAVLHHGYN